MVDDSAVCDDFTQAQLQVHFSLRDTDGDTGLNSDVQVGRVKSHRRVPGPQPKLTNAHANLKPRTFQTCFHSRRHLFNSTPNLST